MFHFSIQIKQVTQLLRQSQVTCDVFLIGFTLSQAEIGKFGNRENLYIKSVSALKGPCYLDWGPQCFLQVSVSTKGNISFNFKPCVVIF